MWIFIGLAALSIALGVLYRGGFRFLNGIVPTLRPRLPAAAAGNKQWLLILGEATGLLLVFLTLYWLGWNSALIGLLLFAGITGFATKKTLPGKVLGFTALFFFSLMTGIFFSPALERGGKEIHRGINEGKWFEERQPGQGDAITAKDSGQIIAPIHEYSVWLMIPYGKCLNWWTNDPGNDNDVARRYVERETGEVYAGDGKGVKITARSWKSKTGKPVRVHYNLSEPTGDACHKDF